MVKLQRFEYLNESPSFGIRIFGDDILKAYNIFKIDMPTIEEKDVDNIAIIIECAMDLSYIRYTLCGYYEGLYECKDITMEEFANCILINQ